MTAINDDCGRILVIALPVKTNGTLCALIQFLLGSLIRNL